MSRRTRAKTHSPRGTIPAKARDSSQSASSEPTRLGGSVGEASDFRFKLIDAILLTILLGFALLMITNSGLSNGQELWPMPDAVEYAASAVNMDRGMGPVLHFGGV